MENKFTCNMCKKRFDLKRSGFCGYSKGNLCNKCWEKMRKEQMKNERKSELIKEKEFEDKVRKILNRWWKEKNEK